MRHRIVRDSVTTIAPVRVVISAATGPRGLPGDGSGGPTGPVVESLEGQTGAITLGDVGAVASSDPRLSDPRTPTAHTHTVGEVSGAVTTSDPRLSDPRTPTPHTHTISDVSGLASPVGVGWHAAVGEWWLSSNTWGAVGYVATNIWSSADNSEKKVAFTPLIITAERRVDAIAIRLGGPSNGTGATMGVGIWSCAGGGMPETLVKDFGTAAITVGGLKTLLSTEVALTPGHYLIGLYVENLTAGGGTANPTFAGAAYTSASISDPSPASMSSIYPALIMEADAWPPSTLTSPTLLRFSGGRGHHFWLRRSS